MHVVGAGYEMGYFDEPIGDRSRLVAVVIRRAPDACMQHVSLFSWRGITSALGFWGVRFVPEQRRRRFARTTFESMPDGYDSAAGQGENRMLYSRSMRKVRFGDTEYPLGAEDLTTVILVDDRVSPREIVVRTIPAPTVARVHYDHTLEKKENVERLTASHRAQMKAWCDAVGSDPDIRAFVDAPVKSP